MTLLKFKNLLSLMFITLCLTMTFNSQTRDDILKMEQRVAHRVDPKQLACLAANIFYEAGHESTEGKAAVARVVMNRVHSGFGNTPCKVVYQATVVHKDDEVIKMCQFSWVCEGKGIPNTHDIQYQNSLQVAYDVLAFDSYKEVLPRSALFFHNLSASIDSSWPYHKIKKIGNHIFYSKQNGKNKQ